MKKLTSLGLAMGLVPWHAPWDRCRARYLARYTYPGQVAVIGAFGLAGRALPRRAVTTGPPSSGQQPRPACTPKDFDNNGMTDLLVFNHQTGEVRIGLLDTNSTLRWVSIARGSNRTRSEPWRTSKAIATRASFGMTAAAGALAMWFMGADGKVQDVPVTDSQGQVRLPQGWHVGGTGDFNLDVSRDLLVRRLWRGRCMFHERCHVYRRRHAPKLPPSRELVPTPKNSNPGNVLNCPSG